MSCRAEQNIAFNFYIIFLAFRTWHIRKIRLTKNSIDVCRKDQLAIVHSISMHEIVSIDVLEYERDPAVCEKNELLHLVSSSKIVGTTLPMGETELLQSAETFIKINVSPTDFRPFSDTLSRNQNSRCKVIQIKTKVSGSNFGQKFCLITLTDEGCQDFVADLKRCIDVARRRATFRSQLNWIQLKLRSVYISPASQIIFAALIATVRDLFFLLHSDSQTL